MNEFQIIERIRQAMPGAHSSVALGIGDDAAVVAPPPGYDLVTSTDTLNAGRHFLPDTDPKGLGHKSLAVSLSDIAAMGAAPCWALLNLTLPGLDEDWLDGFTAGFATLAAASGVSLIGGDTCRGPLSITVTVMGIVKTGQAVPRSGACPGDLVAVSGCLGDAALALESLRKGRKVPDALLRSLERPEPRLMLGQSLPGLASACIDLSDGLVSDLGHICSASGCGADLNLGDLPASAPLAALPEEERWNLQLAGGDDYELCFTLPAGNGGLLDDLRRESGVKLTEIGEISGESGVRCKAPGGTPFTPQCYGYDHFDSKDDDDG